MNSLVCTTLLVETSPQSLPLGAACIASSIKADSRTKNVFSVSLIDFSLEDEKILLAGKNNGDEGIANLIAAQLAQKKPDFVCFSVYVWNRTVLEKACYLLKKLLPNCVCISGGPEVTAAPLSFGSFDFMIAGHGERAIVDLLVAIRNTRIFHTQKNSSSISFKQGYAFNIQGVYQSKTSIHEFSDSYKNPSTENSQYTFSSFSTQYKCEIIRACPLPPDMTASPYLDGTIDPQKYGGALWELARGCPFKCSYCYESKGEKKIAYFPLDRLEKEIELFAAKKIPQVFVLDPTYNANKERAIKMLKIIEKKAPGMFFYFEARAEFIDRVLAHAFSRIPCCLQIGLQSANPEVLKNVNRTLDKKRFIKNIGFLNEAGVTFGFDLIYGLPGDNFRGFCESIDFALSLYPNNLELFCLSVLPGTDLCDAASNFDLEWEQNPPYHVLKTPQFSESDLKKAENLSYATNLFYTKGRAVAWFNSVLYVLKEKPSKFLKKFEEFLEKISRAETRVTASHSYLPQIIYSEYEIENFQITFIQLRFREKHLEHFLPAAEDLIRMHAALGRCTYDGTESNFTTHYHPDDVMSEYGTDIKFFTENCEKQKCKVRVFMGKNGADWKVEN